MPRENKAATERRELVEGMAFKLGNALRLLSLAENRMQHGVRRGQASLLQPGIEDQQRAIKLVSAVQQQLAALTVGESE